VPGAVQDGKVSEGVIPAGKEKNADLETATAADSPVIHGCPFDYTYDESFDTCLPSSDLFSTLDGEKPWPDIVGGYVGLFGGSPGDLLLEAGFGVYVFVGGLGMP
jgi:hypothetical protein